MTHKVARLQIHRSKFQVNVTEKLISSTKKKNLDVIHDLMGCINDFL